MRASTSKSSRVAFTVPVLLSSRQRRSRMLPSMTHSRCGRASPGAVAAPGSSVSGLKRFSFSWRYSHVASDSSTCASTSMRNMLSPPPHNWCGDRRQKSVISGGTAPFNRRLLQRAGGVKERRPATGNIRRNQSIRSIHRRAAEVSELEQISNITANVNSLRRVLRGCRDCSE